MAEPGASHPIKTLCSLLDLTPQRIQQLTAEGILVKVARGRYDLVKSVRGYISYLRDRASRAASGEDTSLSRKRMVDADLAEIELKIRKAEIILVSDVDEMQQRIAATVRTKLLGVPSKVAPLITPKMNAARIEAIVRTAIDDALLELTAMEAKSA